MTIVLALLAFGISILTWRLMIGMSGHTNRMREQIELLKAEIATLKTAAPDPDPATGSGMWTATIRAKGARTPYTQRVQAQSFDDAAGQLLRQGVRPENIVTIVKGGK